MSRDVVHESQIVTGSEVEVNCFACLLGVVSHQGLETFWSSVCWLAIPDTRKLECCLWLTNMTHLSLLLSLLCNLD